MPSESQASDSKELELEWSGPISIQDAQQLLDKLGVETVESLSIEVATDTQHSLPSQILPTDRTDSTGASEQSPDKEEPAPNIQASSGAFDLLEILNSDGGWLRTKELRERLPEDGSVKKENIGSVLWNLADRNLAEKRPYKKDKRETEYQITSLGKEVFDAVRSESESSKKAEVAAD